MRENGFGSIIPKPIGEIRNGERSAPERRRTAPRPRGSVVHAWRGGRPQGRITAGPAGGARAVRTLHLPARVRGGTPGCGLQLVENLAQMELAEFDMNTAQPARDLIAHRNGDVRHGCDGRE